MELTSTLLRRLTPHCANALEAAVSLCQTRGHHQITIEHWLLKLLELGEGDISVVAHHCQWDKEKIWQQLLMVLEQQPVRFSHHPQLSTKLSSLLQAAWLIASLEDGGESIRSIHLLQALNNQPQWLNESATIGLMHLSAPALARLRPLLRQISCERADAQTVAEREDQAQVAGNLSADEDGSHSSGAVAPAATNTEQQRYLAKFTLDLTQKARQGKIDPVLGRDDEIRQMIDILSRRRKNNPILVGEPGVGKTALVEGLALRICQGHVPQSLLTVRVMILDLGLLQAGAGVKGEFEQRLKNVIDAVQQAPHPILLFIDEAHTLIGAGNQAGGADAANLLKPALARGELRTIAATTWAEYKRYFEQDAALARRFQLIKVDEPSDQQAQLMLRGLQHHYARHHGVHIQDHAVQMAVQLSRRYLTGRQLPDKAVDLLDTACARVRMSLDTLPEPILHQQAQLAALQIEQQAVMADLQLYPAQEAEQRLVHLQRAQQTCQQQLADDQQQYQQEKQLIEQIIALRKQVLADQDPERVANARQQLAIPQQQLEQLSPSLLSLDVDAQAVAGVVADWTGIPVATLLKDRQSDLLNLETRLMERVKGQTAALTAISQRLKVAQMGLATNSGPLAVFLLVGPSGVGKTETALALAQQLFASEQALITINLSEYQEAHTVAQLKGSPPGYVGYGQGGILTEAVRQRPYCLVLLDEVEKAHPDVLNLFYQVFDKGMMRDGEGREIDFRHTVIVMTANLGSEQLMAALARQPDLPLAEQQHLLQPILTQHFQVALFARLQTIIYQPLNQQALREIVADKLAQIAQRLQQDYGVSCQIEEDCYQMLVVACLSPETGARNLDKLLNQQLLPPLAQWLLEQRQQGKIPHRVKVSWQEEEGLSLTLLG